VYQYGRLPKIIIGTSADKSWHNNDCDSSFNAIRARLFSLKVSLLVMRPSYTPIDLSHDACHIKKRALVSEAVIVNITLWGLRTRVQTLHRQPLLDKQNKQSISPPASLW